MKTLLPTYLRLGPRPRLSCARHFEASGARPQALEQRRPHPAEAAPMSLRSGALVHCPWFSQPNEGSRDPARATSLCNATLGRGSRFGE
jgi:hypothetical protein